MSAFRGRLRCLILGLGWLLAACAPVVITAPAAGGEGVLLPEQLQRAADAYTATARVEATQAAQVTARDASSRATATSARQATLDALAGQQTQVALQLTQSAAVAMSTDIAAQRTQAAGQTATWAAPTATALAGMIESTAAARRQSEGRAANDARREQQIADARGWLLLAVGILFLLGLAGAVVFGVSDILSARAERLRAEAMEASVRAVQFRVMQFGGALLQLRADDAWHVMQAAPAGGPVIDAVAPRPSPVREVPLRARDGTVNLIEVGQAETPERQRVLDLLTLAIRIAGAGSMLVPSAARLGMHAQDWQTAVDHLKAGPDRPAYVQTRPGRPKAGQGGGTQLCQPAYATLGLLRDGIERGDVLPRPAAAAAGTPSGNVQNVISERL